MRLLPGRVQRIGLDIIPRVTNQPPHRLSRPRHHEHPPRRSEVRGARPAPQSAVRHRRHPLAGAGHRRQHRDFHADRPDPAAEAAGEGPRRAGDALSDAAPTTAATWARGCTRIRSIRTSRQRAEPLAEVICRRLVPASLSVDNQTERVSGGDGLRQLLHDARRAAGGRARASTRRRTIRSTRAIRSWSSATTTGSAASRSDPGVVGKKILVNDYPMTIVGVSARRLRGHRPGAVAADPRADHDEDGDDAGVALAARRRPPRPLGAGVRAAEAGLHGGDRGRHRCRACSRRSVSTR